MGYKKVPLNLTWFIFAKYRPI